MIRLPDVSLPPETLTALAGFQQAVDALPTYEQQITEGIRLFQLKRRSAAFRSVLQTLRQMCAGPRRCCYCEDSAATDVEHIWPKDFYPDLVFVWENYLYGCPRCNRPKSNRCDIYLHTNKERLSVPLYVTKHKRHPPSGEPLLINPRWEDPMEFMMLELTDTFFFMPHPSAGAQERERAEHTIRLLNLNEEDVLPEARREAYESYLARLEKYIDRKSKNKPPQTLALIVTSLKRMRHPTVWHEIKRQRKFYREITELFNAAPEALDW